MSDRTPAELEMDRAVEGFCLLLGVLLGIWLGWLVLPAVVGLAWYGYYRFHKAVR